MNTRGGLLAFVAAACFLGENATAQDSQSLGEVARQQRLQKEEATTVTGKNGAGSKVITNEEIPEHAEEEENAKRGRDELLRSPSSKGTKQSAEFWKSRILAQKRQIASLQRRMEEINSSIRFSSFDCGAKCVARNERQRSKQQEVEQLQSQLEQQKKQLEEMQDNARKQGYGSSVYEP